MGTRSKIFMIIMYKKCKTKIQIKINNFKTKMIELTIVDKIIGSITVYNYGEPSEVLMIQALALFPWNIKR